MPDAVPLPPDAPVDLFHLREEIDATALADFLGRCGIRPVWVRPALHADGGPVFTVSVPGDRREDAARLGSAFLQEDPASTERILRRRRVARAVLQAWTLLFTIPDRLDPRRKRLPVATVPLLAALVAGFVVTSLAGALGSEDILTDYGAVSLWHVAAGEWWRLLAAVFLHGDGAHLLANAYGLFFLGRYAEYLFGPARFVILFTLCGLGGSLASISYAELSALPHRYSVGASGAVFGIAGILVGTAVFRRRHTPQGLRLAVGIGLLPFIAYVLFTGFRQEGVDNAAHVGGLAAGLLLAFLPWATRLTDIGRRSPVVNGLLGLCLFAMGLSTGAAVWNGLSQRPFRAAYAEAEALRGDGQPAEALRAYRRALQAGPRDPRACVRMAEVFRANGRFRDALAACDCALQLAPDRYPFLAEKSRILIEMGRADEALAAAEEYCRRFPRDARYLVWKADTLLRTDAHAEALAVYRQALVLAPDDPDVLNGVAWMLVGDFLPGGPRTAAEALPLAERAHAARPDDMAILDTLGWTYFKAERYAEAVTALEQVVRKRPAEAEFRYRLAAALARAGRDGEASEAYRRARAIDPGDRYRAIAESVLEEPPTARPTPVPSPGRGRGPGG
jgi:membrane associated rhomboid family serine protease/Flp pilus assembly protein TadD